MAAFDIKLVPTTIATSTTGDVETGMDSIGAGLGEPWSPNGASTVLKAIDATYCDWNTAGVQPASQQFGGSGWVLSTDGVTTNDVAIGAAATISGVSIVVDGTNVVASLDLTECSIFAAIKEKSGAGGIITPTYLGNPQFSDADTIINNGGLGPGTYPFTGEIVGSNGVLAGLSAANLKTVLRSSTLFLEMIITNDDGTVFDLKMDRIAIRVVGDDGASTTAEHVGRHVTVGPGGGLVAARANIRGAFSR